MAKVAKETDPLLPSHLNQGNVTISDSHDKGFSFGVALAFSVNFSMGAGFLSLPWAFHQAGIGLSTLVMIVVAIPLFISILFNLEAMARATAIERSSPQESPSSPTEPLVVGSERYEVSDLCSKFMGKSSKLCFLFLLSIYSYGCLWSYSAVFARAMSSTFPLGENIDSYVVYLILYAMIVVPLTCMEVNEQIYVQVFLAFCRLAVVLSMVGSVLLAYLNDPTVLSSSEGTPFDFSQLVHFNSLHIILPIATFAFIFTHNVPVISEPVEDKRQLHWIYLSTIVICFLGYSSIGMFVSLYFRETVQSSCNLNWSTLSSTGTDQSGELSITNPTSLVFPPLISRLISTYVVMFPALDVVSAYPLNAITLGNNLLVLFLNHAEHVHHTQLSHSVTILYRLLAAVPSFFLAYFFSSDVGVITDFTGICGFFLAFIFPPLVAHFSEKYYQDRKWNSETIYSHSFWTSSLMRYFVFVFGVIIIIYTILTTISQHFQKIQ